MLLSRKLPLSEAVRWTPAQLTTLGFPPLDREGRVRVPRSARTAPDVTPSLKLDLGYLRSMRPYIKPEKYERALEQILDRWQVPEAERAQYRHPGRGYRRVVGRPRKGVK